jgi:hypothetical protein
LEIYLRQVFAADLIAVAGHVDRLIALTSDVDLEKAEKDSLLGSLKWLRSHSIRSADRCFVLERLPDRKYQDL